MKIYIEHTDGKFYPFNEWLPALEYPQVELSTDLIPTSTRDFEIGSRVYFQGVGWTEVKEEKDAGCEICVFDQALDCDDHPCLRAGKTGVVFVKLDPITSDKTPDPVNHPAHYTSKNGVECIQVTEQFNFARGNAIKYIWRAGEKDPTKEVEDLEKAVWYIQREIKRIKAERND